MTEFEDVWQDLVRYAQAEQTVSTFVRESENKIEYNVEEDAIVFISDQPDPISRETWKHAWEELQREGELTKDSFKKVTGTYRASVALPFLAQALNLRSDPTEPRIWDSDDVEQ